MANFWNKLKSKSDTLRFSSQIKNLSLDMIDELYAESATYNHNMILDGYPNEKIKLLYAEIESNEEFSSTMTPDSVQKLMNLAAHRSYIKTDYLKYVPQDVKEIAYTNMVSDINQKYSKLIFSHIISTSTNFDTVIAGIDINHGNGQYSPMFTENPNLSSKQLFECVDKSFDTIYTLGPSDFMYNTRLDDLTNVLHQIMLHPNVSPTESLECFDILKSKSVGDTQLIEKGLVKTFMTKINFDAETAKLICSYNDNELIDVVKDVTNDALLRTDVDSNYAQKRFDSAGYVVDFDSNTLVTPDNNIHFSLKVKDSSDFLDTLTATERDANIETIPSKFANSEAIKPLLNAVAVEHYNDNIKTLIDNIHEEYGSVLYNDIQLDLSDLEDNDTIGFLRP